MRKPRERKAPGAACGAGTRGEVIIITNGLTTTRSSDYGTAAIAAEEPIASAQSLQRRRLRSLGLMPSTEGLVAALVFGEVAR